MQCLLLYIDIKYMQFTQDMRYKISTIQDKQ